MKKIFTFLVAVMALTSVFAQNGRNDRGNYYGQNSSYDNRNNGYDNRNGGYDSRNNVYNNSNEGYSSQSGWNDRKAHQMTDYGQADRQYGYRNQPIYENHDNNRSYYDRSPSYNTYERSDRYGSSGHSGTLKAVGAGLVIGGILALLASH